MSIESSHKILVVGSGQEAHLAITHLRSHFAEASLFHLPCSEKADETWFTQTSSGDKSAPSELRICDVWGSTLLKVSLPAYRLAQAEIGSISGVESLAEGLKLSRVKASEEAYLATLSDGTELLCSAVLFADGWDSRAHSFWTQPAKVGEDSNTVHCWSFERDKVINAKSWEFRWSAAKSVEIVPLGEKLQIKLRFQSAYGAKLSVTELSDLFSHFGSDMTALFENLTEEDIEAQEESAWTEGVFCPLPGCVALGRAAFANRTLLTFSWLSDFVQAQMGVLVEQLQAGAIKAESFEAQSSELVEQLRRKETFLRSQLHLSQPLLFSLRNLVLKIVPGALLKSKVEDRLFSDQP